MVIPTVEMVESALREIMQFNTTEVLSYTEPAASLLAGPLENARVLQPELAACFGSPSGRLERPQAPLEVQPSVRTLMTMCIIRVLSCLRVTFSALLASPTGKPRS